MRIKLQNGQWLDTKSPNIGSIVLFDAYVRVFFVKENSFTYIPWHGILMAEEDVR